MIHSTVDRCDVDKCDPRRIFDVELLLLAKLMDPPVPIAEVPIRWNEVSGSKLSILKDGITMAIELLIIRSNYLLGVWKVPLNRTTSPTL